MTRLPDFIIIGAAKSGTSALYAYLALHPEIFMSGIKETNYFALLDEPPEFDPSIPDPTGELRNESIVRYRESINRGVTNLEDYLGLFKDVADSQVIGEVSPFYLYHPHAAGRIHHLAPSTRLIAILRNPAERAYSQYMQFVRDSRDDSRDFITAIKREPVDVGDVWWGIRHYIRAGFYYKQLRRYYDTFQHDQIRVFLYEDLKNNPVTTVSELLEFVGVDPGYSLDLSTKHNVSGIPRFRRLQQLLYRPNPIRKFLQATVPGSVRRAIVNGAWYSRLAKWNLQRQEMTPDERNHATNYYLNDITRLQELIKRDLSHWMQ